MAYLETLLEVNDLESGDFTLKETYAIDAGDFAAAGEISSKIKKKLKQIGIDSNIIRRATIAAYEAELNVVIHSMGGELILELGPKMLQIIVMDIGPGIDGIDLAMREGYSTAPDNVRQMGFGAGMGLPNMKRCSDDFSIQSKVGQGTVVRILIHLSQNAK
ncbi:MAG: ATP-binding protein [Clostridia bacterium]|jgi:serine/threonine-protein kinase RsbT